MEENFAFWSGFLGMRKEGVLERTQKGEKYDVE